MAQNDGMELGRVGIWTGHLDLQPLARIPEIAAELETLGYDAITIRRDLAGLERVVEAQWTQPRR